ncbi:helix-turn-helix domain-containing protein [filamentous cyanobacterium LEGE 11480]|uniref:Helix-turn-helix domain-containing protein n=1 Tax=Romeriopsis navalis LEGE 11480 TaxID=2777977 RepID=A0A928Z537_9CYAN|nr:helix-turn-helix domain-containing protein [Romeriopsis navalis]MBE9031053.1 helix-turn-helix domain-containing protein [Romeriopsis navalis LEGE 11480]
MHQRQYIYYQSPTEAAAPQPVGRPKTVDQAYLDRLRELVTHSPKSFGYGFKRWTAYWLRQHLLAEFQVTVSERHINRLLRQMGLSTRQRIQVQQGQPTYRHKIEISDLSQVQS